MTKKKASKKTSKKSANANASAAAKPSNADLPEGFTQMGGGYAPTWDVEKQPVLHGTVTGAPRDVELTIGRKKQTRRCLEMTTLDGSERFTVWESAALGDFFDAVIEAGEGGEYFLRFDGYGKKKPGQNPPKLFTVAAKA